MPNTTGKLITFEGIDGSGKSTQARLFYERIKEEGLPAKIYREPGGTQTGDLLRRIILDLNVNLNSISELLLFCAARSELQDVLREDLNNGNVVVLDRYWASTIAYQGWGRGIDVSKICYLMHDIIGCVVPDITVLIDLPVEEVEHRRHLRNRETDRFEQEKREFYQRIREGYLSISEYARYFGNIVLIDGMQPGTQTIEEIHEAVYQVASPILSSLAGRVSTIDASI